jgi:hypothetical protein
MRCGSEVLKEIKSDMLLPFTVLPVNL